MVGYGSIICMSETKSKVRCAWAESDALMRAYHDEEWGVPVRDSRELWETLMLESAQAGLSWAIILRKREGYRRAFKGFDPKKVAKFGEADVERLMLDEGIVRARAKIIATIEGAKIFNAMEKSGEDFSAWVWGIAGGKPLMNSGAVPAQTEVSEKMSKELKKRGFKFVGLVIVYAWMQAVGMVNDHAETCFRRKAVKR